MCLLLRGVQSPVIRLIIKWTLIYLYSSSFLAIFVTERQYLSCIEWRFYSSFGRPANIRRYILHLRSTLRTADCDVIVNIHGLTWRNILPIESDVASSKLKVLITTLVVWRNGRSHWARHIKFGYITILLSTKGREPLILFWEQNYMYVEFIDWELWTAEY